MPPDALPPPTGPLRPDVPHRGLVCVLALGSTAMGVVAVPAGLLGGLFLAGGMNPWWGIGILAAVAVGTWLAWGYWRHVLGGPRAAWFWWTSALFNLPGVLGGLFGVVLSLSGDADAFASLVMVALSLWPTFAVYVSVRCALAADPAPGSAAFPIPPPPLDADA